MGHLHCLVVICLAFRLPVLQFGRLDVWRAATVLAFHFEELAIMDFAEVLGAHRDIVACYTKKPTAKRKV